MRDERATSILIQLAAEYIAREAGRETLITPTRADVSPDRKNATIYVSVFPAEHAQHAVDFLVRHNDLFRAHLKKHSRLPVLPRVTWKFDSGEANRQHLDDLSREL